MTRPRAGRARRLGLWALWLCVSACSETKPLTQIVVVVDSDLDVPNELDSLQIAVSGALNMPSATAALRGGDLPRSLGLVHAGGPLGPVRVSVRGFLDDTLVLERTAAVRFVQDKTLQLRLALARACAARVNEPCDDGETCDAGECASEQIQSLPEFTGKLPAHAPQAGSGAEGGAGGEAAGGAGGMDSVESGAGGRASAGEAAQNSPPTCEITQPADHASFYLGDSVKLSGTCTDADSGTPSEWVWNSSLQGTIGSAQSAQFMPQLGEHTISLCASDAVDSAISGCAPMIVIDVQALPSIGAQIESLKQSGSSVTPFFSDKDVVAAGSGTGVAPLKLSWSDPLVGSLGDAAGLTLRLPAGKHALLLTVSDARSRTAAVVSGYFDVLEPGQSALLAGFDAINPALGVTGPAIALDADADNLLVVSSNSGSGSGGPGPGPGPGSTSTLYRLSTSNLMPATAGGTSVLTGGMVTLRDVFAHPASQHAYLATSDGYVSCTTTSSGIDSNTCQYSKDAATNWVGGEINTVLRLVAPGNSKDYLVLGTPTGMLACDAADCANSNQYLKNIAVSDLAIAGDVLWIASAIGLYSSDLTQSNGLSGASPKLQKDTPRMLTAIAAGSSGVWLGSAAGLARFDISSKATSVWNTTTAAGAFERLASNDVRALAVARSASGSGSQREVIWIATSAGVSRFDPSIPSFITLTTADGLPSNSVRSVLVLANGDKLFGTDAGIALYRGP